MAVRVHGERAGCAKEDCAACSGSTRSTRAATDEPFCAHMLSYTTCSIYLVAAAAYSLCGALQDVRARLPSPGADATPVLVRERS